MSKANQFCCIFCKNSSYQIVSDSVRDDPDKHIKVVSCSSCDLIQLTPVPLGEEQTNYSGTTFKSIGMDDGYADLRQRNEWDTLRRIEHLRILVQDVFGEKQKIRYVDLGCGYGWCVDKTKQLGWQAEGIDADPGSVAIASKMHHGNFKLVPVGSEFDALPKKTYDLVTTFHVLEHVADPVQFVRGALSLLSRPGLLYIEVPNVQDENLQFIPAYKDFHWQRFHIAYYNVTTLQKVLEAAGAEQFSIVGIQRYGIENLFHWTIHNSPQLGRPSYQTQYPALARAEQAWKQVREEQLISDTLVAIVRLT